MQVGYLVGSSVIWLGLDHGTTGCSAADCSVIVHCGLDRTGGGSGVGGSLPPQIYNLAGLDMCRAVRILTKSLRLIRVVVAILLFWLSMAACGGGTPSSPSPVPPSTTTAPPQAPDPTPTPTPSPTPTPTPSPTPTPPPSVLVTLVLTSGETAATVAGAAVEIDGRRFTTDGAGIINIDPAPARGASVRISHGDYLERLTTVSGGSRVGITLWPRASATGLTEQLTEELVYTSSNARPPREQPLSRLRDTAITVELSDSLRGDTAVVQAHERAVTLITQATEGRVVFRLGSCTAGTCIRVTSGTTTGQGEARVQLNAQGYIVGGQILYADNTFAARFDIALHEMGHIYGLHHGSGNIMMCGPIAGVGQCQGPLPIREFGQFTPPERLIMKLMLQRPAGTVFPDDDRGTAMVATRTVVTCGF